MREMSVEGANLEHTLREVALMAALVGSGVSPTQAIRRVEVEEAQLLRGHPGEAVEPYHTGAFGAGQLMQPWGKGTQPWGAGMQPWGACMQPWGAGMQPSGKGAMPYGPTLTPYQKDTGFGTYGKGMGMTPTTVMPQMGGKGF
ncbi:MAG: hypothetical protein ACOY94_24955 [Bacillota bacterium]